jgi:hypothetical protein
MLLFGWTTEQIAYVKQRHEQHTGVALEANAISVLELVKWWALREWPEPLSVQIAGVDTEGDIGWASAAVCSTGRAVPYPGYKGELK